MSVSVTQLVIRLAGGVGLGALFFGGLRITLARIPDTARPGLLLAGSFVLRSAVVVLGMVWLGAGRWELYGATLAGFVLGKLLLIAVFAPRGSRHAAARAPAAEGKSRCS